jgi:hypothetical protein
MKATNAPTSISKTLKSKPGAPNIRPGLRKKFTVGLPPSAAHGFCRFLCCYQYQKCRATLQSGCQYKQHQLHQTIGSVRRNTNNSRVRIGLTASAAIATPKRPINDICTVRFAMLADMCSATNDVRYGLKADILIRVLHLGITFWCDKCVLDLPCRVASAFLDRLRTFSPDVSPRRGGL